VDVTANLVTLHSDDDRRDSSLRRQALETSQYPNATFKLTQPIRLGALPKDGPTLHATAVGELTLHGVTKSVRIDLSATRSGGMITITGSLPITFSDFNIQKPTSFIVLSVLLVVGLLAGIGFGVYNAGVDQGLAQNVSAAASGAPAVAYGYPGYYGHWGFGFGFFGIFFWILGIFLIFALLRAAFGWGR